jgi:5S rRNA maturation endonuclease (ribonuclease M5)
VEENFLQTFFEAKGFIDIKTNNEMDVLCPFPHDKGYETRPSAHVNVEKGTFHCKTCKAEGRFSEGGLSETGFIAEYYGMPYGEAIQFLASHKKDYDADDSHKKWVDSLLSHEEGVTYLGNRGITEELIREYELGYDGSGIIYPVYINGIMLDRRVYNLHQEGTEAKIKSERGAKPLLFPYDKWMEKLEGSPSTLLTAGENDTLLARKYGFNAVESTMGEGSFPKMFLRLFEGRKVIICYDCDEAGKTASKQIAFLLKEAKADVYIADLGLSGAKDDKDVTDFFIKRKGTQSAFAQILESSAKFDENMYIEIKNKEYPLVDLWDVPEGKYSGKRLSSRVIMMGKFSTPMETPSAIHAECDNYDSEAAMCQGCPYAREQERWWMLDDDHLEDVLELVEVNRSTQWKVMNRIMRIPPSCTNPPRLTVREKKHVVKVIFSPDVDTESELSGFRAAEQHAYVIGHNLEDGQRYRVFFKRYAHPNDKQKIVMVVDRVEESDNSLNTFKMTPEMKQTLSQFCGHPTDIATARFALAKEVVGTFVNEMVVKAINIIFHSVLEFRYAGRIIKGYPEGAIIGESRTGKTDTASTLEQFYGLGNFTVAKNATTAGLLGGADRMPSGEFRISWGKIPLNHKGLLILDEMSGLSKEVMATLTDMRSSGVATIEKIVKGKAPAKTRLLWLSNPRTNSDGNSRSVDDYPNGVKIVLDLVGSDEDIARFDFVYIMPKSKAYIPPRFDEDREDVKAKVDHTPYHNLIQWAWSRKSEHIQFDKGVEKYIWQVQQELNEKYDTDVKFFGTEAFKKLARIAVSSAVQCFSTDETGECAVVKKEHVDWASEFLISCYDNDVFRLREYAEQAKFTTTTNEQVNNLFASLVHSNPLIMKTLVNSTETSLRMLESISGLERKEFTPIVANLTRNGLIKEAGRDNVMATKRFREALKAYRENIDGQRLKPLSEQGGNFI